MKKKILAYFAITVLFLGILFSFWRQEWKYLLPTPIPKNYVAVAPNAVLDLETLPVGKLMQARKQQKPVFLHFFSPVCPCSAYNIAHFKYLVKTYSRQVDFYAVLFSDEEGYDKQDFWKKYGVDIPIIDQKGIDIAIACSVYSTPQAVLIDNKKLFYRGNYNKSRFCTDKSTNFAEIALQSLLAGKPLPAFGKLAEVAYGCELPEK